jgi:hypothetical protein
MDESVRAESEMENAGVRTSPENAMRNVSLQVPAV